MKTGPPHVASVLAIYGKFAILQNVIKIIVVAILISSRFVCSFQSKNMVLKSFALLLGYTVEARSGDLRADDDDNNRQKNRCFIPCACARGNNR